MAGVARCGTTCRRARGDAVTWRLGGTRATGRGVLVAAAGVLLAFQAARSPLIQVGKDQLVSGSGPARPLVESQLSIDPQQRNRHRGYARLFERPRRQRLPVSLARRRTHLVGRSVRLGKPSDDDGRSFAKPLLISESCESRGGGRRSLRMCAIVCFGCAVPTRSTECSFSVRVTGARRGHVPCAGIIARSGILHAEHRGEP